MGRLIPNAKARFFDSNGDPLVGGKLYTYLAGTTTPLATYSDNEVTPNANPVVLDANGEADIWLAAASNYKLVLKDADEVTQWTVDDVPGSESAPTSYLSNGGWRANVEHAVTDGQSAADLSGETIDSDDYSSAYYVAEIIRGTTVISTMHLAVQFLNGTARVVTGIAMAAEPHGVTFSVSQTGTVAQLRAALDSGAGNGTIKLSRKLFAA